MKQTTILTACILFFSMLAVSCHNSDDDVLLTNTDITQIITQDNGWKVSYYWDKDKDETNDFSGYVFYFRSTGTFEATHNGTTTSGTWQVRNSSDSSQRLVLSSGTTAKPLKDVDDDWIILEMNDNSIKLKDDNTEHLEELYFERI
ncbi:MAG TPA: hypothetical protein ENJ95_04110 [Bacteroidetes bacterium]|nr:hypothetical protein [Bacteroidota bacterium]